MKDFVTFGLVAWFFLILVGCAHTSDSTAGLPRQQEVAIAQTNAAPAPVVAVAQTNVAPASEGVIAPGTPRVELPEVAFDFGLVSDGNDYIHVFKVRNVGTGDLTIKKIMPG